MAEDIFAEGRRRVRRFNDHDDFAGERARELRTLDRPVPDYLAMVRKVPARPAVIKRAPTLDPLNSYAERRRSGSSYYGTAASIASPYTSSSLSTSILERDPKTIPTTRVPRQSETNALGRRLVNGIYRSPAQDLKSEQLRRMSDRNLSQLKQAQLQQAQQKRRTSAKALAADRRYEFASAYPKTIYGTFAQMRPSAMGKLRFLVPNNVLPCIQREERRRVLFAKKKAGGSGSRRRKRFTAFSHISCV